MIKEKHFFACVESMVTAQPKFCRQTISHLQAGLIVFFCSKEWRWGKAVEPIAKPRQCESMKMEKSYVDRETRSSLSMLDLKDDKL